MISGLVFDIRRYSIHDGPGIRTSVFLKGCPLRCLWCHNPEGLSAGPEILMRGERCLRPSAAPGRVAGDACVSCARACPLGLEPWEQAGSKACAECPSFGACALVCPADALQLVGRKMGVEEVMAELRADLPFYEDSGGGATFSGGEPLAQPEFLLALLRECRKEGIHSALDTSGWASRELALEAGLGADLVLFDMKLIDDQRHSASTGVPSGPILGNLGALAAAGAKIALRVPLITGVNDAEADLESAARYAASLGGDIAVYLLPYHDSARGKYALRGAEYGMGDAKPPSPEALREAARAFERAGLAVSIGG